MKLRNSFWGLLFVAAAAMLILGGMGIIPEVGVWKMILTIFFVFLLIAGFRKLEFCGILFPLAFLAILYDTELGIEAITPWPILGAALLGSIGLGLIFRKKQGIHVTFGNGSYHDNGAKYKNYNEYKEKSYSETSEAGEMFNSSVTFGSSTKYIESDCFNRGRIECNFGSTNLYFDNAKLKNGRGYVDCEVNFGSLDIYVPTSWSVEDHTERAFGSSHIRNNGGDGEQVLVIQGDVAFGSIRLHYV